MNEIDITVPSMNLFCARCHDVEGTEYPKDIEFGPEYMCTKCAPVPSTND